MMPVYTPVQEPEAIRRLSTAQKARLKIADGFISKWISQLSPADLENAIINNIDPKIAWNASGLKQDASQVLWLAKAGNTIADIFGSGKSRKSASATLLEHYVTRENIMLYCEYAKHKYPAHIEVIQRLSPRSINYLEHSLRELLKDLL